MIQGLQRPPSRPVGVLSAKSDSGGDGEDVDISAQLEADRVMKQLEEQGKAVVSEMWSLKGVMRP